jgi:hypothetical protein
MLFNCFDIIFSSDVRDLQLRFFSVVGNANLCSVFLGVIRHCNEIICKYKY